MRWLVAVLLVSLLGGVGAPTVQADAKADAEFVANQFMTQKSIDAIFANMSPLLRQALSGSLSNGPARELSEKSRQIVIEEFIKGFKAKFAIRIKRQYVDIYEGTLTEGELEALRKFLETPEGAAFAAKQHVLMTRGGTVGQKMGQEIGLQINREIGMRLAKEGGAFLPNTADREILLRMFPSR